MTPVITLVTHAEAPHGVQDDHLLAEAIVRGGGDVRYLRVKRLGRGAEAAIFCYS